MTLRVRLALWYGTLLTLALTLALLVAYLAHADAHLADIDTVLDAAWREGAGQAREGTASGGRLASFSLAVATLPNANALGAAVLDAEAKRIVERVGPYPEEIFDATVLGLSSGFHTVRFGDQRLRVLTGPTGGPGAERLAVILSLRRIDAALATLRAQLLVIAGVGVALAVLGGWVTSGRALRPVALLTETARAIAASREFSRRVPPVEQRGEVGELAQTFNDMLASLEEAHAQQRRFLADVSHELRTPLSVIRANAELLAGAPHGGPTPAEAAARIDREAVRLSRLVDGLLALGRAEAFAEPLAARPVQLDEMLMEVFDELRPHAGARLRVLGLDAARVEGEADRLKQLLLILIDNALRYTPDGGPVDLSLALQEGQAILRVDDAGIGVPPDFTERLFQRFHREPAARRLNPEGTGLGLAIARWIVERHGGSISLAPRRPRGTRALVRLPLAAADGSAGGRTARRHAGEAAAGSVTSGRHNRVLGSSHASVEGRDAPA